MNRLPIESILDTRRAGFPRGTVIGRSRLGRPLLGWSFGRGPRVVSLIGGAHADEPVGPEMLLRLVSFLDGLELSNPLLAEWSWRIVPHINPDGAAVNAGWSSCTVPALGARSAPGYGYRFSTYFDSVVRETPGDDLEFGFPRTPLDHGPDGAARPEARAVAELLRATVPVALHGTFHSMAFGAGPWFLLEPTWVDRTRGLRKALANRVHRLGYRLHDVDRHGEKGFHRIEEGFCTRPDSEAMQQYFLDRGDAETAGRFRPSSMELVRSFGGDPLTIVSEMPLFLVPARPTTEASSDGKAPPLPVDLPRRRQFGAWAHEVRRTSGRAGLDREVASLGIRPMALRDQMHLQLAFLDEALEAVDGNPATP